MKYFLIIISIFFSSVVFSQTKEFKKMIDKTIDHTVKTISVDSLKQHFNSFTILDAREQKEYDISHLEDAVFVGYDNFNIKKTSKKITTNKPIVVYCSIGYRSEKIAEKLQAKGYKVFNLYGGIFQWKNEDNCVVTSDNIKTDEVHCYNKTWSVWLLKGIKKY